MLKKLLACVAILVLAGVVHAADNADKTVSAAIHSLLPTAVIDAVNPSDLPGFYEVTIGGQIAYVSADGKYLLQGTLYNVPAKRDLTAASIADQRAQAVAKLPANQQIRFDAATPRHTVTVFTDVDCPYCAAFHQKIAQFNAAGISVHYVFRPLEIHPGADRKAEDVWCAKDRKTAYTAAMSGGAIASAECANPVAATKALAIALGINATPTVLAEDGSTVDLSKAANAQMLLAELDRISAARAKSDKVAAR
jgi:thiol:disulfide interchange protein DsbC